MTVQNAASQRQNQASDPGGSTWLSANAGSGKTRVLTDRVARLLLDGVPPENILCLTYTKAAASEMQNRLFKRLGEWAMLDDVKLSGELAEIGETAQPDLPLARTLFAHAIETPGGLKIQTIHSFCSALLRQFPLEAGVSPQFRELDESSSSHLIDEVLDEMATSADPTLAPISAIFSGDSLTDLAMSVISHQDAFSKDLSAADIFGRFGLRPELTPNDIVDAAVAPGDGDLIQRILPILQTGGKLDVSAAKKLSSVSNPAQYGDLTALESTFLSGEKAKEPFSSKAGKFPSKPLRNGPLSSLVPALDALMDRVAQVREVRISYELARRTTALHAFARNFLTAYRSAKQDRAVLDFDDLIRHARDLLTVRDAAEWVLYRLDGRIDHILVDEAQDTNPSQWQVIEALAREMSSGHGARDNAQRSLFVVGDRKQSIYSFQGADPRAYEAMKDKLSAHLRDGGAMSPLELEYSFRSSHAILSTVDTVFTGDFAEGLGQDIKHRAFHDHMPGRVDLWPAVAKPDVEEMPAWYDPVDRIAANNPAVILADIIAARLKAMLESGTIPAENGLRRRIMPGDILILVQGRGLLFDQIIRACKATQLKIAGADRLKIAAELAVKDLLALMSFLALPEDDLSLAAALKSPLFGWDEKMLFDLAHARENRYLWAELRQRRDDFRETVDRLDMLRGQTDFRRPYELLELILTQMGGRRNLLARLGPEAEDGINELLSQALAYEQEAVPSLTGFIARARSENIEIKRQSDTSGELIRVMTVHGAKGLESPIVILPDTMRADTPRQSTILRDTDGTALWSVAKPETPSVMLAARAAREAADTEERRRLLYVAMTRAEVWLIVCGVENARSSGATWHSMVKDGMVAAGAVAMDFPTGQGLRISHADWDTGAMKDDANSGTDKAESIEFRFDPATAPAAVDRPKSPSDLGGAKIVGAASQIDDEDAALRKGRQIHLLLEHLPSVDPTERRSFGHSLLSRGPDRASGPEAQSLLDEALGVLMRAELAHIFAPDTFAEVDITAFIEPLDARISGTIDRLIVGPDLVQVVDFKTNQVVPEAPEDTPEGVLRQMGAYLNAVEQIYPNREAELSILWTATAALMVLPHGIERSALDRSTTS